MTTDELEELRRIAEAATPGPWEVSGPDYGTGNMQYATTVFFTDEYRDELDICRAPGERDEAAESADLEYIATFDPPTVLTLLGELKRLRQERETLLPLLRDVKAWYEFCFDTIECECEYGHTCGRNERNREYERIVKHISLLSGKGGGVE